MPVRIYRPHGPSGTRPAVVFCHGGGFVLCDLESHDGFCRAMARHTETVVVSVDYRLAPEHRAPAAPRDTFAAFCWVVEHADEFGHRPGTGADRRGQRGREPRCGHRAAVPRAGRADARRAGADLSRHRPDIRHVQLPAYASGYVNTRAAMQWYWAQYLGGAELPSPEYLAAPARAASHEGLPPAVVVTAGFECLHSEGVAYADGCVRRKCLWCIAITRACFMAS